MLPVSPKIVSDIIFVVMELSREISIEQLPRSHHNSLTSLLSEPQLQAAVTTQDNEVNVTHGLTEISDKVESILLERIRDGSKIALFQLGQLYFEQVTCLYIFEEVITMK